MKISMFVKDINMYALYSDKVSVHGKYYSDYYREKFQKRLKRREV